MFCIIFHKLMKLRSFEWLNVSSVIHTNEHTKYANCGLDVNFWNFKDHFNQNLLHWPLVLFEISLFGQETQI